MNNILTTENKTFCIDRIQNEVDDTRYCVLDCTDPKNIDYFFVPLIFLESFSEPAAVLKIGDHVVQLPLSWSLLVCDAEYSDLELTPITSLNDRGFHTMVYNPLKHMVPRPMMIDFIDVYTDIKWHFPKMRNGNILVMPVEDKEVPLCILAVKETSKIPEVIDIGALFE